MRKSTKYLQTWQHQYESKYSTISGYKITLLRGIRCPSCKKLNSITEERTITDSQGELHHFLHCKYCSYIIKLR
jgi:hypothetical protein